MRTLPLKRFALVFLLLVSLLGGLRPAYACGPFSREAIFRYTKHPDFPLDGFARGQLGILQPTYARSYLYAAYRYMNGSSFNPAEQQALLSLWHERVAFEWEDKAEAGKTTWLAARKQVKGEGAEPKIEVYRAKGKDDYDNFLNCPADAFENAAQTLAARIKQFGADSAEVKDWLQAQDKVFANCSEGETIPEAASASAPQLIRADRAYQIAAANFYSMKFDEAKIQFEKIASDSSSPWHDTAQYLAARSMIRKASLGDEAHRDQALADAETSLKHALTEIKAGALHDSGVKLLNLVRMRLRPVERLHELAASLMRKEANDNLKQDLWDYTALLDKFLGDENEPADETLKKSLGRLAEDDLSDWLQTFQASDKDSFEHSLDRWKKTSSNAWLVASLSKAKGTDASVSSLLSAVDKLEPDSPAYATASFHAVRLSLESNDRAGARTRLDAILKQSQLSSQASTVNQFLNQRMLLSSSLEEFLKYAQRQPAAFSWDDDGREIPIEQKELSQDNELKQLVGRTLFDADSTRIMNEQFPLSLLLEAASSRTLPDHLRKRIALAGWTRAVMLNDSEAGRALAKILSNLAPEMKSYLDQYLAANTPANSKAVALYTLLKFPGTRPFVVPGVGRFTPLNERDSYRDNWWCARSPDSYNSEDEADSSEDGATTKAAVSKVEVVEMDFLSAAQKAAGKKERAGLQALGTAPNYLAREVIAWANRTPNDPRIPEALHIVVMATRYGCSDKDTGALSKAAWQLLHDRYAKSEWARKTPYWFKD